LSVAPLSDSHLVVAMIETCLCRIELILTQVGRKGRREM
jgi:hypothetical protein